MKTCSRSADSTHTTRVESHLQRLRQQDASRPCRFEDIFVLPPHGSPKMRRCAQGVCQTSCAQFDTNGPFSPKWLPFWRDAHARKTPKKKMRKFLQLCMMNFFRFFPNNLAKSQEKPMCSLGWEEPWLFIWWVIRFFQRPAHTERLHQRRFVWNAHPNNSNLFRLVLPCHTTGFVRPVCSFFHTLFPKDLPLLSASPPLSGPCFHPFSR